MAVCRALSSGIRRWFPICSPFVPQCLGFHGGVVPQRNRVENNDDYWRDLSARALEQLETETFGGYSWDDVSNNYRKKLLKWRVKKFIDKEKRELKPGPVKPQENAELLKNRKFGLRQQMRENAKQAIATSKLRVAVDCEWGETQSPKQNIRLVKQLVEMERYNRTTAHPAKLFLTGLCEGDRIYKEGYKYGKKGLNGFLFSDITPLSPKEFFSKEEIVYLSPDGTETLTSIDLTKVYIIGGIVDIGGSIGQTLEKAEREGVKSMKLPVTDYMNLNENKRQRCILCLNQVLAILLDLYVGKEWTQTLSCHVPSRLASMK